MNFYTKLNPNILLTEICNQNCDYCFAKNEMESAAKKEMNLDDLKKIVEFLKANNQSEIRLIGGEPTLHSQFKEIVDLILSQDLRIHLFTNGLFSQELGHWLGERGESIRYMFNLSTSAFDSESGRRIIASNFDALKNSKIWAGITIDTIDFRPEPIIEFIKHNDIKSVRLGIANRLIGDKNWLSFEQYKIFGSLIYSLIKKLKEKTSVDAISLNCGFTPCMFSSEQISYFLNNEKIKIRGWGCGGKKGIFDISTDLSTFPCFILDNFKVKNIFAFKNLEMAKKFLDNLIFYTAGDFSIFEPCRKCPHFKNRECGGPCRGWVVNNSNRQKDFLKLPKTLYFEIVYRLLYLFRNRM